MRRFLPAVRIILLGVFLVVAAALAGAGGRGGRG